MEGREEGGTRTGKGGVREETKESGNGRTEGEEGGKGRREGRGGEREGRRGVVLISAIS